ncbi:MAG: polyprenyl synthetase family protein [Alphaproteobacteria bacterium]
MSTDAITMGTLNTSSATAESRATPISLVADELSRVEARVRELTLSREPQLQSIGHGLIDAGGKRVRPALALLVFRACGGDDPSDTIEVGAALELIHSATLLHDDILDSGQTRRGRPSPLAVHGPSLTLVAGDFLFSKAFGVAGRFDAEVVGWATDACISLCEGEIMQQRFRRNPGVTEADYLEIADRKTASLFAEASRIGARFAGAPEAVVDAMRGLGREIGMAFQMVDDLLDVLGPADVIGKPVGSDLREGSPALPTVLALGRLPEVARTFVDPAPSPESVRGAIAALKASGVVAEVREKARGRIARAFGHLDRLCPSPFRDALSELVSEMQARTA